MSAITLDMITKRMAFLVGGKLVVEYSGERRFPLGNVVQLHVDFALDPKKPYSDFDVLTNNVLKEAAKALVAHLERRRAEKTFDLPTDRAISGGYEVSSHRFNGCALRGLVKRNYVTHDESGIPNGEVDRYRFDVLYLPDQSQ